MATVVKPSSVAARKTRIAISDRLATSSFFIKSGFADRGVLCGAGGFLQARNACAACLTSVSKSSREPFATGASYALRKLFEEPVFPRQVGVVVIEREDHA